MTRSHRHEFVCYLVLTGVLLWLPLWSYLVLNRRGLIVACDTRQRAKCIAAHLGGTVLPMPWLLVAGLRLAMRRGA